MKYPALDVSHADSELLLAAIDECSPTAVETHDSSLTIFFADSADRDCAQRAIERAFPSAVARTREVDDENWARRSQESLAPITVGRITVTPPWCEQPRGLNPQPPAPSPPPSLAHDSSELRRGTPERQGRGRGQPLAPSPQPPAPSPQPLVIVIAPSMGFGTGHHATTRLCLAALQVVDPVGGLALDVGTGSGVLAMAARLLGAGEAIGLDNDRDAIQSARENLASNPAVDRVRFEVADLRVAPLPRSDLVTANLTGALLIRSASRLLEALVSKGTLIVSGLQTSERQDVMKAFSAARLVWEAEDDGWTALAFSLCKPRR